MSAWVTASCAGVAVAFAGLLMLGRWPGIGVWALVSGAVLGHWAGRRASDCGVLATLGGMPVAQLAVPPARVVQRSTTPVADLARIRSAGCGVVDVDGVERVLSSERLDRFEVDLLLSGRWDQLAAPAAMLDGQVPADRLARLPDEDETWLVRTAIGLLTLRAEQLRAAASRIERDRRSAVDASGAPSGTRRVSGLRRQSISTSGRWP